MARGTLSFGSLDFERQARKQTQRFYRTLQSVLNKFIPSKNDQIRLGLDELEAPADNILEEEMDFVFHGRYPVRVDSGQSIRFKFPIAFVKILRRYGVNGFRAIKKPRSESIILCPARNWSTYTQEIFQQLKDIDSEEAKRKIESSWLYIKLDSQDRITLRNQLFEDPGKFSGELTIWGLVKWIEVTKEDSD